MSGSAVMYSREEVCRSVNQHLLSILKVGPQHEVAWVAPQSLLSPDRFDVIAKALYVRLTRLDRKSAWPLTVYREHLRVWGGFDEGDGSGKQGFDEYLRRFEVLIDSLAADGFDSDKGLVPVGEEDLIIDGAHRIGAALALGKDVRIVRFPVVANHYDAEYFRSRGLSSEISDAIALEYCRLSKALRVAVIFPVAKGRDGECDQILARCGSILYEKRVIFNRVGRANLIRLLYRGESWLGDGMSESPGLRHHIENRFISGRAVRFVFFDADGGLTVADAKERIRSLYDLENDSIHINDHHHQSLDLAQQVLNSNGIHFLNHARAVQMPVFDALFSRLSSWVEDNGLDRERICIDGSGVMAAYGLRDVNDLDFLFCGEAEPGDAGEGISCHNEEAIHYREKICDLVLDPANYFWWKGFKFVALPVLYRMKQRRGEAKDRRDLVRIDSLSGGGSAAALGMRLRAALPEVVYGLRHRSISFLKRLVPARLKPFAKAVYDLPALLMEYLGPPVRTMTYRGFELVYSRGTSLVRMLGHGAVYEQRLSAYVIESLKGEDQGLFIDIGANIGLITLNVLHELPQRKVWAFEPGPHQASLFRETIARNELAGNVELRETALSNFEGTVEFCAHSSAHSSGDGFLDTRRAGSTSKVEVSCERLDDIWTSRNSPEVTLIKIDTEGAELWVLQGAVELLEACSPIIVFELDARNLQPYPYEATDLLEFFSKINYSVRELGGSLVTPQTLNEAMSRTGDFVATRAETESQD